MKSRRNFLKDGALIVTSVASPLLRWAASGQGENSVPIPGADRMIIRSLRFLDLEMPPEYANSWLTPVPHFYVRNHMIEPAKVDAAQWKLNISLNARATGAHFKIPRFQEFSGNAVQSVMHDSPAHALLMSYSAPG